MFEQLFNTIQNSGIGSFLGKQNHLLGAIAELFHIAGLILLLASLLIIALRLMGWGLLSLSVRELSLSTSRFIWLGLVFLVVSGLILFVPAANVYYPNKIFWFKFQVLLLALIVHFTLYQYVTRRQQVHAWLARGTAVITIGLWFSVAFAGRFVGFF